MEVTLRLSLVPVKGGVFDLKVSGTTAAERDPAKIKLMIGDHTAFDAPLEVVNDIIKMLETAKFAIKQHSLGSL